MLLLLLLYSAHARAPVAVLRVHISIRIEQDPDDRLGRGMRGEVQRRRAVGRRRRKELFWAVEANELLGGGDIPA